MRVLVGCEISQIVTKAFRKRGHEAYSCDLLPTEGNPEWHIQGDLLDILNQNWDLGIFHPPYTHLAVSGARWFKEKQADGRQQKGIDFFRKLIDAPIQKICVEIPISIMSLHYRKPDQIIQPYQFGHEVQKATCLWLKGVPKLIPTKIVDNGLIYVDSKGGIFTMRVKRAYSPLMLLPRNADRWKIRSTTFQGIAEAMAQQWG